MSEQSALNRQEVEDSAYARPDGLLEHLNLPPKAIRFIRRKQGAIWAVTIMAVAVVVVVSLYGSYRTYRVNKAASALSSAMAAEEGQRRQLLAAVASEYKRTPAWRWGLIEEAHLAVTQGEVDAAIALFERAEEKTGRKDPLLPLLLHGLAAAKEQKGDLEEALTTLGRLVEIDGFSAPALVAMSRIHERLENPDEAVRLYKVYMARQKEDHPGSSTLERDLVQARINALAK